MILVGACHPSTTPLREEAQTRLVVAVAHRPEESETILVVLVTNIVLIEERDVRTARVVYREISGGRLTPVGFPEKSDRMQPGQALDDLRSIVF